MTSAEITKKSHELLEKHQIGTNDFWLVSAVVGDGEQRMSFVSNLDYTLNLARQMSSSGAKVVVLGRNADTHQVLHAEFKKSHLTSIEIAPTKDYIQCLN